MRMAVGSDHAGFGLKETLKQYLAGRGIEVRDFGTTGKESVDYPDFGRPVAEAVASGDCSCGILVCSTGIGMSIVANKVKGVRAAVVYNVDVAVQSKAHLNCNVLVFGEKFIGPETALAAVERWLATSFEGGRHERRLKKIIDQEVR
jgi:ribose 5-phosphate isomerase B